MTFYQYTSSLYTDMNMNINIVELGSRIVLQKKIMANQIPDRPLGADLVIYEHGTDPREGMVLYGWDEIDTFIGDFEHPRYCYLKMSHSKMGI